MTKYINNQFEIQGNPLDLPVIREQKEQRCLVRDFMENQRPEDRGQPLFISCPCPKCSPFTMS